MEDEDLEDDGETTPVDAGEDGPEDSGILNVPVHSTPSNNNTTPIDATASNVPALTGPAQIAYGLSMGSAAGGHTLPTWGNIPGMAPAWATDPTVPMETRLARIAQAVRQSYATNTSHSAAPGSQAQAQPQQSAGGAAQDVTGMMGAAMLDDVDDTDEAFGEDSEVLPER